MELHLDITGDDKVVSKVIEKMMGAEVMKEAQESTTGGHVTHAEHTPTHTQCTPTHETPKATPEEPKKRHPGCPKKNAADDEDEMLRDKIFG